jgi:hypothetical protein
MMAQKTTFDYYMSALLERRGLDGVYTRMQQEDKTLLRCIEDCTLPATREMHTLIDQTHLACYMAANQVYGYALKAEVPSAVGPMNMRFFCIESDGLWYPQIFASLGTYIVQLESSFPQLPPDIHGGGKISVKKSSMEQLFELDSAPRGKLIFGTDMTTAQATELWRALAPIYAQGIQRLQVPGYLFRLERGLEIAQEKTQRFLTNNGIASRFMHEDARDFGMRIESRLTLQRLIEKLR